MSIREKLTLKDEIEARNEAREREFLQARTLGKFSETVCDFNKTVNDAAEAIHSGIDILAKHYGVERSELLELLVNTLWAQEQTKAQEG